MLTIEIIGLEDTKQRQLDSRVREAAVQLGVPFVVKKVTEVDDILLCGIVRTPALRVQSQILSQGIVPELVELQSLLTSFVA